MPLYPKVISLFKFIVILLNKTPHSLTHYCNYFDADKRTIYRYISDLNTIGFDISIKNNNVVLNNYNNNVLFNIMQITTNEAIVLNKALQMVDAGNAIKNQLQKKLGLFDTNTINNMLIEQTDNQIIKSLNYAINNKLVVMLNSYSSGSSLKILDRYVEPFELKNNYSYVMCYDIESQTNKMFKISRCKSVTVTKIKWENGHLHQSLPTDIFRICGTVNKPIKLQLTLLARNLLIEEFCGADSYLTQLNQNNYILDCNVADYQGVARFCMGLPGHVLIIESQTLKNYIIKQKNVYNRHAF